MRRRLYWLLPDVDSATRCANDLLLARIEDRHMHFLARRGTPLGELHEASMMQKSDVRHGALLGAVIGGIMGGLVAVALSFMPLGTWTIGHVGVLLLIGFGIFFGIWAATLVGISVPNSRLRRFADAIEHGAVLLIVDVPFLRVDDIHLLLEKKHPEARWEGVDPTVPAFP
jgi:hypothetical protein